MFSNNNGNGPFNWQFRQNYQPGGGTPRFNQNLHNQQTFQFSNMNPVCFKQEVFNQSLKQNFNQQQNTRTHSLFDPDLQNRLQFGFQQSNYRHSEMLPSANHVGNIFTSNFQSQQNMVKQHQATRSCYMPQQNLQNRSLSGFWQTNSPGRNTLTTNYTQQFHNQHYTSPASPRYSRHTNRHQLRQPSRSPLSSNTRRKAAPGEITYESRDKLSISLSTLEIGKETSENSDKTSYSEEIHETVVDVSVKEDVNSDDDTKYIDTLDNSRGDKVEVQNLSINCSNLSVIIGDDLSCVQAEEVQYLSDQNSGSNISTENLTMTMDVTRQTRETTTEPVNCTDSVGGNAETNMHMNNIKHIPIVQLSNRDETPQLSRTFTESEVSMLAGCDAVTENQEMEGEEDLSKEVGVNMISPIDGDAEESDETSEEGDVFKTAPNSDRADAPAITKDNGSDYTMATASSSNSDTMIETAPSSIDDDPDNHSRAVAKDECIGQAKYDSANNPDNVLRKTLNKDTDNNGNDKVLETATESNIDDNSNDNVLLTDSDSDTNDKVLKTASDSEIDKDTEDQLLEMACDSDSNENINDTLLETDSDGEKNANINEKPLKTDSDGENNENINDKLIETVADSNSNENISDKPLETVADSDSNENINEKPLETASDSDSNENINDKPLQTVSDSDSNENINDKLLETASDSDSDDVAINKGHRTKFCIESEDSDESKSDDDLLTTAPAFLKSVKEIMERPPPATPEKFVVSRHCSLNSSLELTSEPYVPKRPAMFGKSKSAYSIDSLLADKAKADEMKRFMDKIHRDLKSEGDFIQMLGKAEETVNTEQLPEEQQKVLDNFIIEDSCISDDRPGQHVFTAARYRCLFGETLHPTQCGFAVPQNPRYIEKYLAEITADHYLQLLTADIIQMCFSKVTHQGPVLRWLLFIMSVHESFGVQQGCHKVLMDLLHSQALKGLPKWSPSVVDVISILVNYGANLEDLVPAETSVSHDSIRSRLYQQPQYMPPVDGGQNGGYQLHNLRLVLEVVAYSLQEKMYCPLSFAYWEK